MTMISTDGFFDEALHIQLLPKELEALFNEAGWDTVARYRVWGRIAGDSYRKTFGEVKMFTSIGTDGMRRNIGFMNGYGGRVTLPGQEPTISRNSHLGELDEVEGSLGERFRFRVHPILPNSAIVYDAEETIVSEDDYTLNHETGELRFVSGRMPEAPLRATYSLTDNAPEMTRRMWFFTFEDFRPERHILNREGLDEARLVNEMNAVFSFKLRPNEKLKRGSIILYDGDNSTENPTGEVIDSGFYTIDYDNGTVTFGEEFTNPPIVYADYSVLIEPTGINYGDIETVPFDAHNPKELAGAAYSGVRLLFPSIPTAVTFIPEDDYGRGWGRDSKIYAWGNVTKDRLVSYFRVDPAPDPEATYFSPLYVGRLSTIGDSPLLNNVLMGGAREEDEIKYETNLQLGRNLVDYGSNTSNGNSSALLQQSIGGAMYQKHYLSFITHDAEVDTSNEARFNPSLYSGKYHISPMYIVHPSDGYVGRLDEVYAVHPKNISQLDELEVVERAKNEHIGTGNGEKATFHFFHTPVLNETFSIQLVSDNGCEEVDPESSTVEIDRRGKTITFTEAPHQGVEIIVNYDYNQVYRYTLADTPITPFQLANVSPYAPIGLGFLKENI